jgi:hypothetical protein
MTRRGERPGNELSSCTLIQRMIALADGATLNRFDDLPYLDDMYRRAWFCYARTAQVVACLHLYTEF